MSSESRAVFRFGEFQLDVPAYELRRRGELVRIERRPMDLLILLLERRGELVSRADIAERLWGSSVYVDIETGVNTAIRKIRQALHDAPERPAFIETVSGKGYRFIANLEVIPAREEIPPRTIIAVLPFEHLGVDSGREYLADGLTEELIAALGQVHPEHFGVIGRTSMMAYKRTTKSLAEIGRELDADFLVESSIRAEAGRLRITSKLIRARDQIQIWSDSYDSVPASVLEFQRELSTAIAREVKLRVSPTRLAALAQRQTQHVEAYDFYLRGRYFWNQLSPPTTRRAIEFYIRATELDPDYTLAWCGLADAYAAAPISGDAAPFEVWPRARDAAGHAVTAGPNLAEAQTSVGYVNFWLEWDWVAAESAFRKAIAIDRNYALAHRTLGVLLSMIGRHEEASSEACRARELDPLDPAHHALSAQIAFHGRSYSAAVQLAHRAIVLDPEFWVGYYQLALASERLGHYDSALNALHKAGMFGSGNSKVLGLRGYIFAKEGQSKEAEDVIGTLATASRQGYVPPYATALVYAGLGERHAAIDWLERAYEVHDVHLTLLTADPKWDPFRADDEFKALLKRCSFVKSVSLTLQ